jgi:DNA-binding NarL/FixJ family response regulator
MNEPLMPPTQPARPGEPLMPPPPAASPPAIARTGRVLVAADGQEAVEAVRSLQPHVVLMDLRMPRLDGIDASRIVTSEFPLVQVLMLSAYEETSLRQEASGTGVFCYLVKGCRPELVIEMVRRGIDRYDLLERRAAAQAERRAESA